MSEYLLDIAARSTGIGTNEMLPSKPVFNGSNAGKVQGFTEENNLEDNTIQNEFVQQKIVPDQPVMPQKVQQAAVLNKTETGFTQNNIETSYFSKHIQRVKAENENIPVQNKSTETVSFNIEEEPSQKTGVEHLASQQNKNEPVFVNKIVSKIAPEKNETKKQTSEKINKNQAKIDPNIPVNTDEIINSEKQIIQPTDKTDEMQNKKITFSENVRLERITPNLPEQMNKRSVLNSKQNEPVPKLIIGKIIVEILPPKLPVPQRTVTKVVQSSPKDIYSKSNKLIFGLGQL